MVVSGATQIDFPSCMGDPAPNFGAALPCFVAGPENRLAVVAIEQLLAGEDLAAASSCFNPLVLIGPPGSGKCGITRRFSQLLGEGAVEYFSAIDFARQLRSAREEDKLEKFRERLSNLSLLIVEDLQRLPQRAFVQRELRDTIDVLLASDHLVLLTAQRSPATMMSLEASLRDRLAEGLTVQLRLPGVEARQKIFQLASAGRLDSSQLAALAKKTEGPVPQLFRALAELQLASETGHAVSDFRPPIPLKQLIAVVARYYSLTQAALRSPKRRKSLVQLTDLSYAQIGQGLGGRDHSTIMHAHRNAQRLLADDSATQQAVEQLQRILTAV